MNRSLRNHFAKIIKYGVGLTLLLLTIACGGGSGGGGGMPGPTTSGTPPFTPIPTIVGADKTPSIVGIAQIKNINENGIEEKVLSISPGPKDHCCSITATIHGEDGPQDVEIYVTGDTILHTSLEVGGFVSFTAEVKPVQALASASNMQGSNEGLLDLLNTWMLTSGAQKNHVTQGQDCGPGAQDQDCVLVALNISVADSSDSVVYNGSITMDVNDPKDNGQFLQFSVIPKQKSYSFPFSNNLIPAVQAASQYLTTNQFISVSVEFMAGGTPCINPTFDGCYGRVESITILN